MEDGFSSASLRRIWDLQVRRGKPLSRMFPEVESLQEVTRARKQDLRRAQKAGLATSAVLDGLADGADLAKTAADRVLNEALAQLGGEIDAHLRRGSFDWPLSIGSSRRGRQTYQLPDDPLIYFTAKRLEMNLDGLRPGRGASRDTIVAQLLGSLDDKLPKQIVRIDVDSFYESIEHERLIDHLRVTGLGETSLLLVTSFLEKFRSTTGQGKGLPRGVGVSAKLAESYLRKIDGALAAAPGVILSARYVDDIVLLGGVPRPRATPAVDYLSIATKHLGELGLSTNRSKTHTIDASTDGNFGKWEFLGYQLHRSGSTRVSLTERRVTELKRRIDLTLDAWARCDQSNTGLQGLLLNRLRFLTGNARLTNNKRNALVGVYFSNRHLSHTKQLEYLDDSLRFRLQSVSVPANLVDRIDACSFVGGFEQRLVHNFTTKQLRDICRLWRDG